MLKRVLSLLLIPLTTLFANGTSPIENVLKSLFEQLSDPEKQQNDFTVTSHTIELPSGALSYKAITGTLDQYTHGGDKAGKIFFTAYIKDEEDKNRPISFVFDGGPGGASLAMHMGGFGPRRLLLPVEGQRSLPPYQLVDNEQTILDVTDLILIDPIGTGYSEATQDQYKSAYYGVEGDLFSFAEFIRMFCIHFDRWNSPKYLIGASYGTIRACGLSELLLDQGIYLNGVVLMSCALDYNTQISQRDLPFADGFLIPTFAATSWFHKKTMQDKTLEEVVELARNFIYEEYAPMMLRPNRFSGQRKQDFYQKLSHLIGLPVETISRYQARIDEKLFVTEFLSPQRKLIGGVDSRYIGDVSALRSEYVEDPSYQDIRSAFYPAFLHYMQGELETKSEFPKYTAFSLEAFLHWNWWSYDNALTFPNFMQRLRRSLVANPSMKVFIGSGYYDVRTPFAAAEYSIDHLELPESYRDNFQAEYYEAGHGFIFDLPSLKKFKKDLMKFYGY